MIFKDRQEAGQALAQILAQKLLPSKIPVTVLSLLRGGVVVGKEVAERLHAAHLPLPVAKISSSYDPELALGAYCFGEVYGDRQNIENQDIQRAKGKFDSYLKRFHLRKDMYIPLIKDNTVIVVDDGVATGATAKAGALFVKTLKPEKLILAAPVAPSEVSFPEYDRTIIMEQSPYFSAVGEFYENFAEVTDEQANNVMK